MDSIKSKHDGVRYAVKVKHYFRDMPAREEILRRADSALAIFDSPIAAVGEMERFDRSRYELGQGETRRPDCYIVPLKL